MADFSIINVLGENISVKDTLSRTASFMEESSNILSVGKKGGRFSTINDAIKYAKTYCTPSNRVCILITEGTYRETVILNPNPGIDFVGVGNVTIIGSESYPNSPLYTIGKGYFENINFIGTGSYAVHIEAQATGNNNYEKGEMIFNKCSFLNSTDTYAGFGAGLGNGIVLKLIGCTINNHSNNVGLYVHNYPAQNAGNMELVVKDCYFTGAGSKMINIDDTCGIQGISGTSYLIMSFQNNVIPITSNALLVRTSSDLTNYQWMNSDNLIMRNCYGNNISGLNTKQLTYNFTGFAIRVGSYYLGGYIPMDNDFVKKYDINILSCIVQGIGTTPFDSQSTIENMLNIHLTGSNLSSVNYGEIQIKATLTPKNG